MLTFNLLFTVFTNCSFVFFLVSSILGNLKGKVVWITGGSSGIGESLAYLLARNGSKLIISGTNQERLENVRRNCIAEGLAPIIRISFKLYL